MCQKIKGTTADPRLAKGIELINTIHAQQQRIEELERENTYLRGDIEWYARREWQRKCAERRAIQQRADQLDAELEEQRLERVAAERAEYIKRRSESHKRKIFIEAWGMRHISKRKLNKMAREAEAAREADEREAAEKLERQRRARPYKTGQIPLPSFLQQKK